jgi:hypothetical protein
VTSNNDWIWSQLKLWILFNILSLIWGLRCIIFEGITPGLFLACRYCLESCYLVLGLGDLDCHQDIAFRGFLGEYLSVVDE